MYSLLHYLPDICFIIESFKAVNVQFFPPKVELKMSQILRNTIYRIVWNIYYNGAYRYALISENSNRQSTVQSEMRYLSQPMKHDVSSSLSSTFLLLVYCYLKGYFDGIIKRIVQLWKIDSWLMDETYLLSCILMKFAKRHKLFVFFLIFFTLFVVLLD